jgi:protein SCO1/2
VKHLAALLALLLLAPAEARSSAVDLQSFRSLAFRQHPGAQLPLDAALRDESGRPVTLANEFRGRPAIVVLEYLRCQNLCNLVLASTVNAMRQAKLVPGRDLDLVAISIDPRDTAADGTAARTHYAAAFPDPKIAANGLHFLTGAPQQVARVADAVGFSYRYVRGSGQFAHPAGVVVTTPGGRISRYMLGLDPPPAALRTAVAEAGQGDVQPAAHPLLLLCFGYDPDEGTAAALAMRLVRIVSLGGVLGIALLIGLLSFRRRAA